MNKKKLIKASFLNNKVIDCTVYYSETFPWTIKVDCGDSGSFQSEAEDLFEAFINIRKQLLSKGITLLCNACRRNIYPSPMLRQSGGGEKAYLLRMGVPARKEDIINIFDSSEISDVDSLDEQKEFYVQWLKSLEPTPIELEEARKNPDGWVYRIDGNFSDNERIPSNAIIGAWKVNSDGGITNSFDMNEKFEPS